MKSVLLSLFFAGLSSAAFSLATFVNSLVACRPPSAVKSKSVQFFIPIPCEGNHSSSYFSVCFKLECLSYWLTYHVNFMSSGCFFHPQFFSSPNSFIYLARFVYQLCKHIGLKYPGCFCSNGKTPIF